MYNYFNKLCLFPLKKLNYLAEEICVSSSQVMLKGKKKKNEELMKKKTFLPPRAPNPNQIR